MFTLTLAEQDNLFRAVATIGVDYLESNDNFNIVDKKTTGIMRGYRNRRRDEENEELTKITDSDTYTLLIPDGTSILKYNDQEIKITLYRHHIPINILENMRFKTDLKLETEVSLELLTEFCNICYKEYLKKYLGKINQKDTIKHWIWDENYWDDISKRKKRPLSTISLNETGEELLTELKDFMSPETEELYNTLGVNYKKNYLFEGVPGSGKTSLIFALASELNLDIAILHFDSKLTDVKFIQAIQRMPEKCVLVIEDVDHLFIERKKNDEHKNAITFSGILNVLDGFGSQHRQVTFITTNHECVLDSAFKRPGRIDRTIHFDYATKNQIQHMYDRFLPNQKDNFKDFYKKVKHCKITTAVLQTFLFQWRTCDNIIDHIEELITLAGKNEYNKNGANMFS